MHSYRLTCKRHEADINDEGKKNQDSPDNLAAIYDDNYIKGKLEQGLGKVWQVGNFLLNLIDVFVIMENNFTTCFQKFLWRERYIPGVFYEIWLCSRF